MKIGIDGRAAKWYRGTGIGNYTYQIINSINNLDKCDDFLMFMPENCDTDISFNKNFSIRNISEEPSANFWNEINIPNILQDNEVEIYHVPQNGIGLPLVKTCRMVITLHDIIPYKMPETVGPTYLKIFTEQLPLLLPKCDGIITVSNYSKEDIVKYFNFPKDKIYVTHLAPEKIYYPRSKVVSKIILEKYYGISGDFVLYVGGFSPRKNIIGLIEAFSQLNTYYNGSLKLVIAGKKGLSYDIYKKKTEELNIDKQVIFPGFIPIEHMPYLYCGSELFVYPSFYEGFGLPPVEAMACKIPVIASNTTSIPEILNNSALLINPHDSYALYDAMRRVLEDNNLKVQLISNGFARAKELSWRETAAKTISIYKQVVSN